LERGALWISIGSLKKLTSMLGLRVVSILGGVTSASLALRRGLPNSKKVMHVSKVKNESFGLGL
jgi:hypothetical protein